MPYYQFPRPLCRLRLWLAIAVVFGGLLLGKYIIADRLLAVRIAVAPAWAPVMAPATVIIEELIPWNQASNMSVPI